MLCLCNPTLLARQAKRRFEKNLSIFLYSDKNQFILNSFFGSVFSDTDPTATQVNIDQQIFGDPVSEINISAGDIVKKIKNLKTNSDAGPDNISAKFLQTLQNLTLRFLFHLN